MAFSPDGKFLASCDFHIPLRLWNVDINKQERTIQDEGYSEGFEIAY